MDKFIAATPLQLGQILRGFRKQAQLTQVSMADQSGLLQKTISTLESDASQTRVDTLYKALAALDLELVIQKRPNPEEQHQPDAEW